MPLSHHVTSTFAPWLHDRIPNQQGPQGCLTATVSITKHLDHSSLLINYSTKQCVDACFGFPSLAKPRRDCIEPQCSFFHIRKPLHHRSILSY
jgi:hypothetical protein